MLGGAIHRCPLPDYALLAKYEKAGSYTDCYAVEVAGAVSQATYVEAFYTSRAIRIELLLLGLFLAKPSTECKAQQLAAGELDRFSAWHVEDRSPDQLLMCDFSGKTRSWLMVAAQSEGSSLPTRLFFGSAVLPSGTKATGEPRMSLVFTSLLWFHKIYSRVLLSSARARLAKCTDSSA